MYLVHTYMYLHNTYIHKHIYIYIYIFAYSKGIGRAEQRGFKHSPEGLGDAD